MTSLGRGRRVVSVTRKWSSTSRGPRDGIGSSTRCRASIPSLRVKNARIGPANFSLPTSHVPLVSMLRAMTSFRVGAVDGSTAVNELDDERNLPCVVQT